MNNWTKKIKRKSLGSVPTEASLNIQVPETAPLSPPPVVKQKEPKENLSRVAQLEAELAELRDKRISGRTKQLGLKVKAEFLKRLKELAVAEDCFLVEVLEKALECYERKKKEQKIKMQKHKFFKVFKTPLYQQDLDSKIVVEILKEKFGLESVTTSNNTGLLMNCPKCQQVKKLFYSFDGKAFICMNYKDCGLRCISFLKLWKKMNKKST